MKGPYDDIIGLPCPAPSGRQRMPVQDRAAQFAPFSALTGYGDLIREQERRTQARPYLTEELAAELNEKLLELEQACGQSPAVELRLFEADPRKSGGSLRTVTGCVRRIDRTMRTLTMTDGRRLPLDDVFSLELGAAEAGN